MSFEDQMAEHDEQFQSDAKKSGTLADGSYTAAIDLARLEHDESDDTYTVIFRFVDQGESGSIRKWYNLDHEVGRSILAQDLKRFGYEGKLSEIRAYLESEALIDMVCEIKVQTKPGDDRDFTNVYINRVLGKGVQSMSGSTVTSGDPDDDIPF